MGTDPDYLLAQERLETTRRVARAAGYPPASVQMFDLLVAEQAFQQARKQHHDAQAQEYAT